MAKIHLERFTFAFCCLFFFWGSQEIHAAQTMIENPKIIAIQHRDFKLGSEFSAYLGYMPLDSFTTYFNASAGYTHYFNDFLAWEIVNAGYANSSSTGIREYILNTFNLVAPGYDLMEYYITTQVLYTPMYTKNLIFDSRIGYGDISLSMGGGISKFRDMGNVNTITAGVVFRYFLSQRWSFKLDVRNFIFLSGDLKNNLAINLGLGFNLGSSDSTSTEESDE